ncbi:MAG TPA: SusC/RagA family TonB-linked outer membrane protein, partial [Mucilaginibacter sp.]|nr:SusC/RagA family TonB-linked outer membrane protein [Mucilaginibacter sp.]
MYKIYNAFICGKEFCCSKKPLLIMKLTIVMLTMAFLQANAQATKTITGKVVDEKSQPLPGVYVKSKSNPQDATTTDAQGNFKLVVHDAAGTITFSFVGYETQDQVIRGRNVVNVSLAPTNSNLDEVVVVAYGTQKRTSITGSVATIDAAEIKKNSVSDIVNTITGRAPGIRVTQASSEPGKFASLIDIRGFSTMPTNGIDGNATSEQSGPLFVIDGIPRGQSDFARLDPNEIETFSILKDATAAIYGVKAANGVILVTTRKGAAGAVKVDYSGQWGAQFLLKYPELSNAYQYAQLLDERDFNGQVSGKNDPITPLYSAQNIEDYRTGKLPSTDWTRATIKNRTNQQQHNVTLSGGSEKVNFFTSAGYFQEGGVFASGIEKDQKYNFRQDVQATLAKGLVLDVNLGLNDVVQSHPNTGQSSTYNLIRNTWGIPPTEQIYLNGDPRYLTHFLLSSNDNPVGLESRTLAGYDDQNERRLTSVFSLNYTVPGVQGLTAKAQFGFDNNYSLEKNFNKSFNEYLMVNGVLTVYPKNQSYISEKFNESYRNDVQFSLNYAK